MKRQIMKSFMAFCAGVMTLCAASSLFVSCNDFGDEIDSLQEQVNDLDTRLKAIENLKTELAALAERVDDAIFGTLQFQVSEENELQYSFDGKTWVNTGITIADPCDCEPVVIPDIPDPCNCPEISVVDNGDSITIKIGEHSFTIEKPQEILFEVKAGKVYVESEGITVVAFKTSGVEDVTVMAAPKGWYACINADGYIEVTAPNVADTEYTWQEDANGNYSEVPGKAAPSGYIKIHACSADGKCMVGKLAVEVSDTPIVVKAYGGRYEAAVINNALTYLYYGACEVGKLEETVAPLLELLNDVGYNNEYDSTFDPVSGDIADLLGAAPEQGKEYVVWGIGWNWEIESYTMEDFVLAYYTPISVTAVEDESKRTPYDNYITVNVDGAESYYAIAVPASNAGNIEYTKENMVDALYWGMSFGKLYTDSYEGFFYQIANGTDAYVGLGVPGTTGYLLILPMDGRPSDQYTTEDIREFSFSTKALELGGTVKSSLTQVFEAEKYNSSTWEYEVMPLDPYTELAVSIAEPVGDWSYYYFGWVSEDQYNLYKDYDEDLVDLIVTSDSSYPIPPLEVDDWPVVILNQQFKPEQTVYFVAFFLDNDYKVSEVMKLKLTTDELLRSDIMIEPVTNLVEDGTMLKNTQTLEITPNPSEEASMYRYVWAAVNSYNQYEGKTDAEMADLIYFDKYAKTVKAEDLVDGKFTIKGHTYSYPYYLAILPYDKDGNPGRSAYILEYDCAFRLDAVETDPANFKDEPVVEFSIPENKSGSYGVPGFYVSGTTAKYEVNYTVTLVEGTEVATVITSPELYKEYGYDHTISDLLKASDLWSKNIKGSGSYVQIKTSNFTTSPRYMNQYNYADAEAITAYILVSWKDTEGNYYYKEVDLSPSFAWMYNTLMGTETAPKPGTIVSPAQ